MKIKNKSTGVTVFEDASLTMVETVVTALCRGTNLRCADLRDANLNYADLRDANLNYAELSGASLSGARLPAPTMVLLANWGEVSPQLCADLMLFDSMSHPDPSLFDAWSDGGLCPYAHNKVKIQRAAQFYEQRELWGKGVPCRVYDLMSRLLDEKCPKWSDEDRRVRGEVSPRASKTRWAGSRSRSRPR